MRAVSALGIPALGGRDALISLWDMTEFYAHELSYIQAIGESQPSSESVCATDLKDASAVFVDAEQRCKMLGLEISASHAGRAMRRMSRPLTYSEIAEEANEVRRQIHTELKSCVFLQIPKSDADAYYCKAEPFGVEVSAKLGDPNGDIEEAAKCIALDRPTGAVFHLMRFMEFSLQKFGDALGVSVTEEKMWQRILNDLKGPVESLPETTPAEKAYKAECGEVSVHLYHVKLAWRNPSMHPKAVYSIADAREIYDRVRVFSRHLAKIL